jgi:hypothetical protein
MRGNITRRDAVYREARIANLVRLVDLVYAPNADVDEAYKTIREFFSGAAPMPFESTLRSRQSADELRWIQAAAKEHIEQVADGGRWEFKVSELSELDPGFGFVVEPVFRPYGLHYTATNLKAHFLWTLAHLLGGAQGERISRCAETACTKIIVRRKRGAYCAEHRTGRESTRRYREKRRNALSLTKRRESRHRRYERLKGKPAKKRPIRSDELAREAIEAIRRVDSENRRTAR